MWRLFKWLRWGILGLLSLVILVLGLVTAIVATEPGSRWALTQVSDRLPLEFQRLSGNLITGLDIGEVTYAMEDQRYRVEELSFRWQPLALFYSTVSVQSLSAQAIELHLPPPAEEAPADADQPIEWPSLALPVRVELGGVDLNNIRVYRDQMEVEVYRVSGTINLGASNLRLWDLAVGGPDYQVEVNGRTSLRYPYDSNLNVQWQYQLREFDGEPLALAGGGDIDGDLNSITLTHELSAPLALSTELRLWPNLDDPDATPQLVTDNTWPEQAIPHRFLPEGFPALQTAGRLQLEGWLDHYLLELSGDALAEGLPALDFDLLGRGDLEHLEFERLGLALPEGELNSRGRVRWQPQIEWQVDVDLEHLNPASLPLEALADWPGNIEGGLRSEGYLGDSGLVLALDGLTLSGQLRDLPLSARGGVTYEGERLLTRDLSLALGDNTLTLNGTVAEQFDLDAVLNAPDLQQLDESLSGAITAELAVRGSRAEPSGQIHLEGSALRWQDYSVADLELDLEIEPGSEGRYSLSLNTQEWQLNDQVLEQFQLSAEGSLEQHRARAELDAGEMGRLSLTLEGGYEAERWSGHLTEFMLEPRDPLVWELQERAALELSAERASLEELCLMPQSRWLRRAALRLNGDEQSPDEPLNADTPQWLAQRIEQQRDNGRLCLAGHWDAQSGASARAEIRSLPLRLAQRWLQPEVRLAGTLEGDLDFELNSAMEPRGDWRLETRNGAIHYQFDEDDEEIYPWSRARLTGEFAQGRVTSLLDIDWDEVGHARANVALTLDGGELEGELDARFGQLAPLEALLPRLQDVRGELRTSLQLLGTLEQPQLRGDLALSGAQAQLPELGLELKAIGLRARAEANRFELEGEVSSGPGQVSLTGEILDPWTERRRVSASLSGSEFLGINTRELEIQVSPELRLEADSELLTLEGEARIPYGRARFSSIPDTATRVSDDVVVLDPDGNGDPRVAGMEVRTDLTLILGDDVRFEGFGLDARLSGELQVLQSPERGLLTIGEVGVAEGKYKAYGQDLEIERGRLIFQGPQDNPGLDIRAVRETREVTAGLEIEGTLQRPRSRVFSTPAMPDSEAMAILLTGRPLSSGTSADASMLVNAVGNLGLERSGFITAEIAETFSLDEFRIQAEDELTESSLHIGKYVTPQLFVRYVVGLFDQTSRVGMRYELTEGLRLEAESGLHQSVDIIYKFER